VVRTGHAGEVEGGKKNCRSPTMGAVGASTGEGGGSVKRFVMAGRIPSGIQVDRKNIGH